MQERTILLHQVRHFNTEEDIMSRHKLPDVSFVYLKKDGTKEFIVAEFVTIKRGLVYALVNKKIKGFKPANIEAFTMPREQLAFAKAG